MPVYSAIDLSQLPEPLVVESLDYEQILAQMLADLQERDPVFTALVESDTAYKVIEVASYRELLLRRRINDAALAVMLAYAQKSDLDQIGANYNVARMVLDPGDPGANPPVDPTYELDDDYRRRIQLSFEGYTTAGSAASYLFHGLSAAPDVKDVQPVSPTPGVVVVYVLSRSGNGAASPQLVAAVSSALNAEKVRPMTDQVTVQTATIVNYAITAQLVIYPGPDSTVVRQAAVDAVTAYAESQRRLGYDVTLSGIYHALHQSGVQNVVLSSPAANLVIGDGEASYCTAITVTVAGATDV